MPFYHSLGSIPHSRKTWSLNQKETPLYEEIVGETGYLSGSSRVYHRHPPQAFQEIGTPHSVSPKVVPEKSLSALHFAGFDLPCSSDFLESRKTLFVNNDLHVGMAAPCKSLKDYFFKNSDADELFLVDQGQGYVDTMYGKVHFERGDYILIPKNTTYQIHFHNSHNRLLFIESFSPIIVPRRYRKATGQMFEHAPYQERDFKLPKNLELQNCHGEFTVKTKKHGFMHTYLSKTHPFDVVGWDGNHYPWAVSIFDLDSLAGPNEISILGNEIFEALGFSVKSLVPMFAAFPSMSFPIPNHISNNDLYENLYFVDGGFISKNKILSGMQIRRPKVFPLKPLKNAIKRSIREVPKDEVKVMISTHNPLKITQEAIDMNV